MNKTVHTFLLALFLSALGIAIFLHKFLGLGLPVLPDINSNLWLVEARLSLNPSQTAIEEVLESDRFIPARIELKLPKESDYYKIREEDFIAKGYDRDIEIEEDSSKQDKEGRVAVFQKENADSRENIFYQATIFQSKALESDSDSNGSGNFNIARELVSKQFNKLERSEAIIQDNLEENRPTQEIDSLLEEARQKSTDDVSFAREIYRLALNPEDSRIETLRQVLQIEESTPKLAVWLLQEADYEARVGNGLLLSSEENYTADFVRWMEVKSGDRWLAYDPIEDNFGPQGRYLTWWYGFEPVLQGEGLEDIAIAVTVRPNTISMVEDFRERETENIFLDRSLIKLPLSVQRVFRVLVLIPIGALIVSATRQLIGISTFGTFTPILIALSFRETGLIFGLVLFCAVVILGLSIRFYLHQLQLLVIPRLATILTATVLVIAAITIALQDINMPLGLSISLFPIVILAMTIERAAVMWDEAGPRETAIAGFNSILIASIGFLFMSNAYIQHLCFVFPELLLIVLALNLILGRYNGYKLTEYFRFLSMQRELK
ncbi:MAG: UUP1 family membrane protein [Cyanobacteriota bacterium]|nr:UUP1 family membrane protein [Cyanobacteriota bacterium]